MSDSNDVVTFGREVEAEVPQSDFHPENDFEDVITNADKDYMLTDFSAPIIAYFLYDQLDNIILDKPRNILGEILARLSYLKNRFSDDRDVLAHITDVENEILFNTANSIGETFGFKPADYDITSSDSFYSDKVIELYEFFILNRKETIIHVLSAYVTERSRSIVDQFKASTSKLRSNQTFKQLKEKFGADLAYLYIAIPDFLNDEISSIYEAIDMLELLRLSDGSGYTEGLAVDTMAESGDTSDIVQHFFTKNFETGYYEVAALVRSDIFNSDKFKSSNV